MRIPWTTGVPTYFVDGVKVHEGVPTVDKVRKVYERALDL